MLNLLMISRALVVPRVSPSSRSGERGGAGRGEREVVVKRDGCTQAIVEKIMLRREMGD